MEHKGDNCDREEDMGDQDKIVEVSHPTLASKRG
jgi:hypothetical protein